MIFNNSYKYHKLLSTIALIGLNNLNYNPTKLEQYKNNNYSYDYK